jgi:hypothetical protein
MSILAEALGPNYTEEGVQSQLAQAFFAADVEYVKAKNAGTLSEGMTREKFLRNRVTDYLDPLRKGLGDEDVTRLNKFVQGMPLQVMNAFSQQGINENRENRTRYQDELRRTAISQIERREGLDRDKITDEMINKEMSSLSMEGIFANLLGVDSKTLADQQAASGVFRDRLKNTMIAGADMFTSKNATGDLVFDAESAALVQATNSQVIAQHLTRMTTGQMSNAEAIPIKIVENLT